jgi:hypothetical protein
VTVLGELAQLAQDPASWWPADAGAPPLYATPRNPAAYSDGPQVALVARTLGTPFIPWQDHVAQVANERTPEGGYVYPVVLVSVPRQTGKTTLLRANGTHRCLVCGRDVFYTAQKGKDARERWLDLVKVLRNSPTYASRVQVALRAGAETVTFPSGAGFRAFAPTPESLHGYTPPTVMLDEVFAYSAQVGELLMGAIGPAQVTIVDRQLWLVSTAGTADSTFLHDWLDLGMTGAPGVATFLWGARDDQDPYDVRDIERFHPGVGFPLNGKVLTAHDVLRNADLVTRAEYLRAFANRRTRTSSDLIPADKWAALSWQQLELAPEAPPGNELHLVYDVAHDRQSAGIVAVWAPEPGRARIKVVKYAPGTAWLAPAVRELWHQLRPHRLLAAGNGPVVEITQQLQLGVQVLTEQQYATATGRFLSMVDDQLLDHDGTPQLADSIAGLVTRAAITDGVAFSRRASTGDTSLGIGAAIGSWSAVTQPPSTGPLFSFGATP